MLDAARLYRLVLEKGSAGARYHAVAEEGVLVRDIAEVIGRGLKIPVLSKSPEEAMEHFGWLGVFVGERLAGILRANAEAARMASNREPGLIADLEQMSYLEADTVTASAARRSLSVGIGRIKRWKSKIAYSLSPALRRG